MWEYLVKGRETQKGKARGEKYRKKRDRGRDSEGTDDIVKRRERQKENER